MANDPVFIRARDGSCSARLLTAAGDTGGAPLLVCIHGGGCSGRYFEMSRHSVADTALRHGFAVLLIDRPGHAGNPALVADHPIAASVAHLAALVEQVIADYRPATRDAALLGHSIGGAAALMLAADPGELPWRAVAVSGVGDEPPSATRAWAASATSDTFEKGEPVADMFFGPSGTYDWRGPGALRRVAEPWHVEEVLEMMGAWLERWRDVAGRIALPVHLRLAEHDGIWRSDDAIVRRMAACFTRSAQVDAALLPDGGHVYEIHRRGPELIDAQIAFLGQYAATRPALT